MSLDNFIPEVWSRDILSNLNKSLVYAQTGVVNRNYEGEIANAGDTVHINSIGRVSTRSYNPSTGLSDPDVLTSYQQTLTIDQQYEFNFMIGDIDAAQVNTAVMSEATSEAAYSLADRADQYVAAMYTSAGKTIGSDADPVTVVPGSPSSSERNVYEVLVDLSTKLSSTSTDANGITQGGIPTQDRWVIVDPQFYGLLRKDDRFVHADKSGSTQTLRNGEVGEAAGFRVMQSDNVPTVAGDGTNTFNNKKVIAGHRMAWTYAEQINKTEAYRPDKFFSDALRGLHVYGARVVRPEALAVLSVATS